jgi:hypothetical protein
MFRTAPVKSPVLLARRPILLANESGGPPAVPRQAARHGHRMLQVPCGLPHPVSFPRPGYDLDSFGLHHEPAVIGAHMTHTAADSVPPRNALGSTRRRTRGEPGGRRALSPALYCRTWTRQLTTCFWAYAGDLHSRPPSSRRRVPAHSRPYPRSRSLGASHEHI